MFDDFNERLFCGGGISADLSLALYLIDKYCDREIALECSRCSLVDLDRLSQFPFAMFIPHKDHQDVEIKQCQDWIGANYSTSIIYRYSSWRYMARVRFK